MSEFQGPVRYARLSNVDSPNFGIPVRILEWTEGVFFLEVADCGHIEALKINPVNYMRLNVGSQVYLWALEEMGDTFYDDYKMAKEAEDADVFQIDMFTIERVNEESYRDLVQAWHQRVELGAEEEAELAALLGES